MPPQKNFQVEMENPSSTISADDRDLAVLLIGDAARRETSLYYHGSDGKVDTLWDGGRDAKQAGLFFRKPAVEYTLAYLALFDMILCISAKPGLEQWASWTSDVSFILQVIIWVIFSVALLVRLKYMWRAKSNWTQGASEGQFIIGQIIVLWILTPSAYIVDAGAGTTGRYQANSKTIPCVNGYSMFVMGWCRAWTFIYFNKNVRTAMVTVLKVLTRLGPLTGLLLGFFFCHFFIFQSLSIGTSDPQNGWGTNDAANVSNALYDLFSLLTTVNHPDTMLWLVDVKPASFFFIISFMFFTSIIGLNLLLGIVYGEYCTILEENLTGDAELRSDMLMTAFDLLTAGQPKDDAHITTDELEVILREVSAEPEAANTDEDRVHLVVRMIDTKTGEDGKPAVQDHRVDADDMKEVIVLYTAPFQVMSSGKTSLRLNNEIARLESGKSGDGGDSDQFIDNQVEALREMGSDKWAASNKTFYYLVFEQGSNAENFLNSWNPWGDRAILITARNLWFAFYIIECVLTSSSEKGSEASAVLLIVSAVIQTIFVVVKFIGEMRPWQWWHFFNLKGADGIANVTNLGLAICLWVELAGRCSIDNGDGKTGCVRETLVRNASQITIIFTALGKVFQVLNFIVETTAVNTIFTATMKCFPTLGPHFGLFLSVYYAFAGMGIAFFCGLCKESATDNGPGFWGQTTVQQSKGDNTPANYYATATSPASGTAWGSTAYGSNPYYYNLNYDSFISAVASLYVVMIQNNWTTAADGPIQTTNMNFRWFFVIFTLVVAFVMMNVLVGAILDALAGQQELLELKAKGEKTDLEQRLCDRLAGTKAPSGLFYSEIWEVGVMEHHGEVNYDAQLAPSLNEQGHTKEDAEHLEDKKVEKADLQAQLARLKGIDQ
jgi:hypothetical protein